jgi:hypothetical protein
MNGEETREQGYSPNPVKPKILFGKTFSLASFLSLFERKKKETLKEDLRPEIPESNVQ